MIKIRNLQKKFNNVNILSNVSFDVNRGDVIAIIGNSGAGKSTVLRCLIDLEKADNGLIEIDGRKLTDNGKYPPAKEIREITSKMGMVFQNFNLFPHMTVLENLTMPYIMNFKDEKKAAETALKLLEKVGLLQKTNCYPQKLSGGEQQRVAIARALMLNPKVLLFDEPTSALDPIFTNEVLKVIKSIAKENVTMIVVTHEMDFAREAANKILFMSKGVIEEEGTPKDIFESPKSEELKKFLSFSACH